MGMVDAKRIGIVGHSWGAYQTCFLATNTNIFAAAVAGAPLTDLVSMYGSVYWNNGIPETGHYETGQERMEVTLWDDPQAYIRNSPVFSLPKMTAPLLVAFGDKDGAVDWHQGIEMYNMARRLGKDMVLLVYAGENHSPRKETKPDRLSQSHCGLVRSLSGRRPGQGLDDERPNLPGARERAEAPEKSHPTASNRHQLMWGSLSRLRIRFPANPAG